MCEVALNPHHQAWHLERRRVLGCSVCERVNIDEGICAKRVGAALTDEWMSCGTNVLWNITQPLKK